MGDHVLSDGTAAVLLTIAHEVQTDHFVHNLYAYGTISRDHHAIFEHMLVQDGTDPSPADVPAKHRLCAIFRHHHAGEKGHLINDDRIHESLLLYCVLGLIPYLLRYSYPSDIARPEHKTTLYTLYRVVSNASAPY